MNSDEDFLKPPHEYDLAPASKARPPAIVPPPPPIPVAALSYSMPLRERRPGLVTAIGVIGIIVASITMLTCLTVGFSDFGFFALNAVSSNIAAAPRPTATINVAAMGTPSTPTAPNYIPPTDDAIPDDGFKQSDRVSVEGALSSLQSFNNSQFNELDNFLAQSGQSAFPTAGRGLSRGMVGFQVTKSGVYKGSGQADPSYTWFDVRWGRLEVYDDKVTLSSSDPTRPGVTTSIAIPQLATIANPGFAALTPKEIGTVMKQINLMAPNAMNDDQTAALNKTLASPQQNLVPALFLANPVTAAQQNPDGSTLVSFTGGGSAKISSSGAAITTVASQPFLMPKFQINTAGIVLSMIEAVASLGVAIFLLVISIQAFRGSQHTPRRFRIFAWIKIPLAIIGWSATALVWWGLGKSIGSTAAASGGAAVGTSIGTVYTVMSIFAGIAALIFPIALLFVLRSKTVREYFEAA